MVCKSCSRSKVAFADVQRDLDNALMNPGRTVTDLEKAAETIQGIINSSVKPNFRTLRSHELGVLLGKIGKVICERRSFIRNCDFVDLPATELSNKLGGIDSPYAFRSTYDPETDNMLGDWYAADAWLEALCFSNPKIDALAKQLYSDPDLAAKKEERCKAIYNNAVINACLADLEKLESEALLGRCVIL